MITPYYLDIYDIQMVVGGSFTVFYLLALYPLNNLE
jgi:hypothetical protein